MTAVVEGGVEKQTREADEIKETGTIVLTLGCGGELYSQLKGIELVLEKIGERERLQYLFGEVVAREVLKEGELERTEG